MKNLNFIVNTKDANNSKSALIDIGGELTVKFASELKDRLVEIKNTFDKVEIRIDNVSNIDLSAIQLFLSIKKTFSNQGKEIQFSFNFSEETEMLIKKSGFVELLTGNKK